MAGRVKGDSGWVVNVVSVRGRPHGRYSFNFSRYTPKRYDLYQNVVTVEPSAVLGKPRHVFEEDAYVADSKKSHGIQQIS